VIVNDKELRVRENLWNFLHQVRSSVEIEPDDYYWIDAISINQDDVQERGRQVNLMQDIYTNASSVDVWLGLADQTTSTAFTRFFNGPGRFGGNWDALSNRSHYDFRFFRSELEWQVLTALFSKPYWERAWIVQEYVLARNVTIRCGKYFAGSESLDALSYAFSRRRVTWSHDDSAKFTKSPGWIIHQQRVASMEELASGDPSTSRFTVRRLLVAYRSAKCTELLDRVFAFLGLCVDKESNQHPIVADYTKSKIELLIDVIMHCCTWNDRKSVQSNFDFICLMKESLELGSGHSLLTDYISTKCPDLQQWLHIIVGPKYFYTTLYSLGQVEEVGPCVYPISSSPVAATIQSMGPNPPSCVVAELDSEHGTPITLDINYDGLDPDRRLPYLASEFEDLHSFMNRVPSYILTPTTRKDDILLDKWFFLTTDIGQYMAYSTSAFMRGDRICAAASTSRSALVVRNSAPEGDFEPEYKVIGICTSYSPSNVTYSMKNKEESMVFFFSNVDMPAFGQMDLFRIEQVQPTQGLELQEWRSLKGDRGGWPGDERTKEENQTRLKRGATPPPSTGTWVPPDSVGLPGVGTSRPMDGGAGGPLRG
jgi:hypothetical protein